VIPTIGRWGSIANILEDLGAVDKFSIETIVVGDGLPLKVVREELDLIGAAGRSSFCEALPVQSGPARARNRGIAIATAPHIVFLDDDVRLAHGWDAALSALLDAKWQCVTGPVTSNERGVLARAREDRYRRRYSGLTTGDTVNFLAGGNSVIAADLIRVVGGFPDFRVGSDTAILERLRAQDVVCRYSQGLAITHTHDRGWSIALATAWRAGYLSTFAGLRAEARSLLGAIAREPDIGMVNLILLLAKSGGYLTRDWSAAR
jgi:glycosyltransferase involved in cell wall biosynthesis